MNPYEPPQIETNGAEFKPHQSLVRRLFNCVILIAASVVVLVALLLAIDVVLFVIAILRQGPIVPMD